MNSKRVYYLMIAGLIVLVGAIIGGTYFANQQLVKQSKTLVSYKAQNEVLQSEQTGLGRAKRDVAKYQDLDKIARAVVPQDKDQAQTVREIVAIAAASGIKPTAINFPVSSLERAASGTTTQTVPKLSDKQLALSQLTPVKSISGVYNLQITIQQDATSPVSYAQFIAFLNRLEQNRRTAQVTGIVLQPSVTDRNQVSFSLTVNEYIKP